MASTFVYKVKDKQTNLISGSIEGENQTVVVQKLRQMGYTVISINEKTESALKKDLFSGIKLGGGKVKLKDLTVFSRQFATMINAGLPLTRCLSILAEQTENSALARITGEIEKDVEAGQSLSVSLAKYPKAFPKLFIAMVKAGEAGGVLDQVLLRVADHMQNEAELKSKIKSAMAYPTVMLLITLVITTIMIIFIVPIFEKLFKDLGGQLPMATRILLLISKIIRGPGGLLVLAVIVASIFGIKAAKNTENGAFAWDNFKLKLPVIGNLVKKISLANFSRTLGTLISSGTPILQGLDIVAETAGNEVVARSVRNARASIREGETIAKPLSTSSVFPPMVIQMISVGEETGALEHMCSKIADFYESEVAATVEALTSLIEPLLIVFLGAVIGGILVSLYLPMFQIINLIK